MVKALVFLIEELEGDERLPARLCSFWRFPLWVIQVCHQPAPLLNILVERLAAVLS